MASMHYNNRYHTTPIAKNLANTLRAMGNRVELEHFDGHKHVDIFLPEARLYIEVNGLPHYTDPGQLMRDLLRMHYSDLESFNTLCLPNILVEQHGEEIARALTKYTKARMGLT